MAELGNVTTMTYTTAGLIATITDPQSNVTTYGYDSRGNRTSVTDALSHQTTFTYDAMSRLTNITYPDSTTSSFTYDIRGRRTSATDQNGNATSYAYDTADRLTSVTDAASHVTTYAYDTESNLTSIQDANGNTTAFTYDAYGRVTQTNFPSSLSEYYAYDANNNLTSKTDRKSQTITYVYDALNRLTSKTYPDTTAVDYVYDLVGKITQVNDPTGTYTVPSGVAYVRLYCEVYLAASATVARFDDGFVSAGTQYYHQDHLSNRVITNTAGADIDEIGLLPFGESWYTNSTVTKWAFTTYERDAESGGNDYAMARYYISRLGRFNSPDPLDGDITNPESLNSYAYVRNDPIDLIDPLGLCPPCDEGDCGGGGIIIPINIGEGGPGNTDSTLEPEPNPGEPLGDPSGDASPYGTWNESIPGGAQVFPAPFGGINFPSNPAGCTYGGGNCGGGVYGFTDDEGNTVYWPEGFSINILVLDFIAPNTGGHPDRRPLKQQVKDMGPLLESAAKLYFCGRTARGGLREYLIGGATKGAIVGAWGGGWLGAGAGGIGAIPGAIIGAGGGAITGASIGAVAGSIAIPVCSALGVYN